MKKITILLLSLLLMSCSGGTDSPNGITPAISTLNAPINLSTIPGDTQATITWSPVAEATSYNLYWTTLPGVTKSTGTKISNVTSPYIHAGLTNNGFYYYIVTAVNASGESTNSGAAMAIPGTPIAPGNPVTPGVPVIPGTPGTPGTPKIAISGAIYETTDALENIELIGEIQNSGTSTATFVKINFNFYDSTSKLVGTDSTYVIGTVQTLTLINLNDNSCLKPSEKGAFLLLTNIKRSSVARYDYSLTYETYETADPAAKLSIIGNLSVQSGTFNWLNYLGQVKNIGAKGLTFGKVFFLTRNSSGIIIDIDYNYIKGETVFLTSIGTTTDTALSVNGQGTFSVLTVIPFDSHGSHDIKYDWSDDDIVNGVVKVMLGNQDTPISSNILDQKSRFILRDQQIEQLKRRILMQ